MTVSIIWGRSCNYIPRSTVPFNWDGSMSVGDGEVIYLDRLHYKFAQWTQALEIPERIFDRDWALPTRRAGTYLSWRSDTEPGSAGTLEGLRLSVSGNKDTKIKIEFKCTEICFTLGELADKERLTFHVGEKYSGCPIEVYLGIDARDRVSKRRFETVLKENGKVGFMLEPDDFDGRRVTFHSTYGLELTPGARSSAALPQISGTGLCPVRIQMAENFGYSGAFTEDLVRLEITVGRSVCTVTHVFTNRLFLPKMDDIYVYIPRSEVNGTVTIGYTEGNYPVVIHRITFGEDIPSLKDNIEKLPPLPKVRTFHTGSETDLLTHENGEVDFFLDVMRTEEIGDYVMIRERNAIASDDRIARWTEKIKAYGFLSATSGGNDRTVSLLKSILGDRYFGEHGHEISNLIYGWGNAEPIEKRAGRTVPACMQAYIKRMSAYRIIGQALPMQFLDYESGADIVMSEIPASHATLTLCGARGAARTYGRKLWGVHVANHVTRAPLDECHVRRLKILLCQSWLYGAGIAYDEEVAFKYNHDTLYSYSDRIPTAYREIYQSAFHYANNIRLGEPIIDIGFLIGNGDVVTGGLSAGPFCERPCVWGQFGPETEAWKFNTPEDGWKLIDCLLPGVWLYPVEQDKEKIRLFFSGTPNGQVDLVPAFADADILARYKLLVLPGWNSMTPEIYRNLTEYARRGGHLILCAAQCSEHTTRDFLLEKQDFNMIYGGDLTELAGVRIGKVTGNVKSADFNGIHFDFGDGVRGIEVTPNGAEVLAYSDGERPVLVRHKIGSGSVTVLTVGDYWGAGGLGAFNREVVLSAIQDIRGDVFISDGTDAAGNVAAGDAAETDFHRFTYPGGERVVLVNTDWTDGENVKHITVHYGDMQIPADVKQGKMKHVLFSGGLAVWFDVPSAIADVLNVDVGGFDVRLSGCGLTEISVCSPRKITKINTKGFGCSFDGKTVSVDFGDKWNTCILTAEYEKEEK